MGLGNLDYKGLNEKGFGLHKKYKGYLISLSDLAGIRYLQKENVRKFLKRIGCVDDPEEKNILAYRGEMGKKYFEGITAGVDAFCRDHETAFIYSHHHSIALPFYIALRDAYDAAIILDHHIDAYHVKKDGRYYNDGNFLAHEGVPHKKLHILGTPHAGLKWRLAEKLKKDAYAYLTRKGAHCYTHKKKADAFVGGALNKPKTIVFDVDVDVFKFSHSNWPDRGDVDERKWNEFMRALKTRRENIKDVKMVCFSEMNVYWVDGNNNPYDLIIKPALDALGI